MPENVTLQIKRGFSDVEGASSFEDESQATECRQPLEGLEKNKGVIND